MSNSPTIQINAKKTHLMAIAILLLIGAATSTVNIRDELSVFQDLNMNGNDIRNVGNIEGYSGSGGGLDWSTARQVKDSYESDGDYSEASVTCNSNEVLVEASCHKNYDSDGTDVLCDTRTERKAEIVDGDSTGETVWGTCVDKN